MTAKFLTADWRYLAMLNFDVDRSALKNHAFPGREWANLTGMSGPGN